jgi:predicted ATPase
VRRREQLTSRHREPFLREVRLARERVESFDRHPFSVPAVRALDVLELDPGVTVLVGDNGSGKSTLVEAIAVAAGFNPEGGTFGMRFATRESHSELYDHIVVSRGARRPKTGFFLRAESFFNVASYVDESEELRPGLLKSYGGRSLHEQSHGESFLALIANRFGPDGLYVLDEPEAALSLPGCLALLQRMHELVEEGSQFVVATHSPVLMGLPGARLYELSERGIDRVEWEDTEHYRLTRAFLEDRDRFLHHLFGEDR